VSGVFDYIPAVNLLGILIFGLFGMLNLRDGIRLGMELLRQIQAQHQTNSERIAMLQAEAAALDKRVERAEGIINHR
jgi:hypothetical protein